MSIYIAQRKTIEAREQIGDKQIDTLKIFSIFNKKLKTIKNDLVQIGSNI